MKIELSIYRFPCAVRNTRSPIVKTVFHTLWTSSGYQDISHPKIVLGLAVGQTMILEVKNEGRNTLLNQWELERLNGIAINTRKQRKENPVDRTTFCKAEWDHIVL